MAWRVARSLDALLTQLNAMAPQRSKVSDGGIGDAKHATRDSDHNPWFGPAADGNMLVTARDYTHDPAGGLDCNWLANTLIASRDRRIKYIIWNRRILSGAGGPSPWVWRNYPGINPHTKHLHLSVVASAAADGTAPWNLGGPPSGGFLMALSDADQKFILDRIKGMLRQRYYVTVDSGIAVETDANHPGAKAAAVLDSLDGDLLRRTAAAAEQHASEAAQSAMTAAAAAVAAANKVSQIAVGGIDLDALATKLADELDRRARDNDPTTGPRS